jgi:hypothetical protein
MPAASSQGQSGSLASCFEAFLGIEPNPLVDSGPGRSVKRVGQTKQCSECGEAKPKEQFPRSLLSLDGRSSRCLLCKDKEVDRGEKAERFMREQDAKARRKAHRREIGGPGGDASGSR